MIFKNHFGAFISILIHLLIFSIPVSKMITENFGQIELFVIYDDERQFQTKKLTKQKKVIIPPKEHEKQQEKVEEVKLTTVVQIQKEIEQEKEVEQEIVKPIIINKAKTEKIQPTSPSELTSETKVKSPLFHTNFLINSGPLITTKLGQSDIPKFLHREIPEYPRIARKLGKEGKVVLRLTINKAGNLVNIIVVEKAGYGFTEAAINAVKKSTFLPAKKDGRPITSQVILPIRFVLRRN